ncbi:chemotaxis protein CheA [Candidatus Venteria ishoeyi]|uniref:Chemotaxis protein CheA n=1 Tax=Candidatus Venteria ishoeyi TaxID=1899563 RepID=A0A1H6F7U4_9GAMM|nr:chemotaxis protein CheA [Candidatus Venteria ishoeyi]SEH05126.1 Chemotaxis protein CheA [Candidatus Venteria ishoeyi]
MTDLTDDYIIEAREHLDEMETHLLQLEQTPDDINILNSIFTDVHTIKGAAQFTGLSQSSELAHRVEDVLDLLRQETIACTAEISDLLIGSMDRLALLVNEVEQSRQETSEIDDLVEQLNQIINKTDADSIQETDTNPETKAETDAVDETPADDAVDGDSIQNFLTSSKEQFAFISTLLDSLKADSRCENYCPQLISTMMIIAADAQPLGLEKTKDLSEKIAALLVLVEQKDNIIGQPVLTLLNDVIERFTVLFHELELFQLEASPVEDLLERIDDLVQKDFSGTVEDIATETDKLDTDAVNSFIENSRASLTAIEADLLLLENDTHNTAVLTSLASHFATIENAAQLLDLSPVETLCQHTVLLLNQHIDNEQVVTFPLMELLSEMEEQLSVSLTGLENSEALILPVDDLLSHIQLLQQPTEEHEEAEINVNIAGFDTAMVDLSGDTYAEEHDRELFDIFLQQLQNTLQSLQKKVIEQKSVAEYRAEIDTLKSSANYMGYSRLVEFYQQWLDRINTLADSETEDEAITHELMFDYIEALVKTFPQLKLQTVPEPDNLSPSEAAPVLATEESAAAFDEEEINSLKDITDITEITEDNLFNQLSQALEVSTSQGDSDNDAVSDEAMHEIFDKMLTDNENVTDVASKPVPAFTPVASPESKENDYNKKQAEPKITQNKDTKTQSKKPLTDKKSTAKKTKAQQKDTSSSKKVLKRNVRVDAEKIDTLMNQVGELIVDKGYFHQLFNELRLLQKELKENASLNSRELKQVRAFSFRFAEAIVSFGRTSNDLQEGVMKVRMLPISQLFDRYPRLVHDLVHRTDKKVNLEVRGEDTELDKMIIEEISDPLIHLIRNAVDHGIESTEERKAAGKPEVAKLLLEAYNESNHIVIEITDNGRGIDPEKIKAKALDKSLYSEDELARMSQKELFYLIMLPGFSTAKEVSNTSGRGVGMDVVKKNIEKLNGILEIDSKPGTYTKMRLKIPLTLAIIRALQVRVGDSFFTIPLSNVEETLRVYNKETSMMEGTKVIHLRGKTMPIIYLSKLFNIHSDHLSSEKFFVVTVNTGMQQIGLIVDELLGQAEVVIKPLVDYLQEKSGFSGATIIGDGKISLILDIYELVNMTTSKQVLRHQQQQNLKRKSLNLEENNA